MREDWLEKWAALLCDYCLEIGAGQTLGIQTTTAALPLVRVLNRALWRRGAFPWLRLAYPEQRLDFHASAVGAPLERVSAVEVAAFEKLDAFLRIEAEDPALLRAVDPARLIAERRAGAELNRARSGKPWCVTLYPTPGHAAQAEMTLSEFEQFVGEAMLLDLPDPSQGWVNVRAQQQGLVERLSRARTVRLETARTDLTLDVTGRTWRNSDGRRNMPSGEVFTSPLEASANGVVHFDVPTSVSGQRVSGVTLHFTDGVVTAARAEEGEAYLLEALETDAGARRLGEIGIGTNRGIRQGTRNILFDEKIGGTAHLALGSSYTECGGLNESALHWDLILDLRGGGRITLDGEPFQENGEFVT